MKLKILSTITKQLSRKTIQPNPRLSSTLSHNPKSKFYKRNYPKSNLYPRISPLGDPSISLATELDKWVEEGNQVFGGELKDIIRDLRANRRYSQALQVSEWMREKGVCTFSSGEHAVQIDLIGSARGHESAESYFNSLSDKDKDFKTYGSLLNCYVKACLTEKSLSHMQKMKELGVASSPLCYNGLMHIYTKTGNSERVPDLLNEMKENGVIPDKFSYTICINSYGARSNIDEMEKVLEEMQSQIHISMDWSAYATVANFYIKAGLTEKAVSTLKKSEAELGKKDAVGYNHLISLYANLGNKTEVLRLWKLKKTASKKYINADYIMMLHSLLKIEELEEAEKLLKEWETSGRAYDFRVPNVILLAYSKMGLVEKAEAMLEDLVHKGKIPVPNSWAIIAAGYVWRDEMEKAVKFMKMAFNASEYDRVWKPNPEVLCSILQWLGDKCDVEEVEAFVESLKSFSCMDKNVYHALMKANVRAGKDVDTLLESMKADKIDEDEDTEKILSFKQDKSQSVFL